MLELTVVTARLAQFACAMVLLGAPLFFIYGLPARGPRAASDLGWPRPLLLGAALVLAVAGVASLCAQTAVMSGSIADAFKVDALSDVMTHSQFGLGTAARAGLAVAAGLALIVARPSHALWLGLSVLAAGIVASFAWTGHGAIDEGWAGGIHLAGDILHLWAAAAWLGALAVLGLLLIRRSVAKPELAALHRALAKFSGVGSAVVALLLATGLVNSWFLVGPSHLSDLLWTLYGRLLTAKVALFAAMLGLAAANRFRLTPRLGQVLGDDSEATGAVAALRGSVLLETAIAFVVLVLVSLLGTNAPPASH